MMPTMPTMNPATGPATNPAMQQQIQQMQQYIQALQQGGGQTGQGASQLGQAGQGGQMSSPWMGASNMLGALTSNPKVQAGIHNLFNTPPQQSGSFPATPPAGGAGGGTGDWGWLS